MHESTPINVKYILYIVHSLIVSYPFSYDQHFLFSGSNYIHRVSGVAASKVKVMSSIRNNYSCNILERITL